MRTPPPTQHCSQCLCQQFCPHDSRVSLIGQADPADTGHFPSSGPWGHTTAWGWGMCQESWACPQQRTGSQPATRMSPGGLPHPTQVVSTVLPPQQVGSHLTAHLQGPTPRPPGVQI